MAAAAAPPEPPRLLDDQSSSLSSSGSSSDLSSGSSRTAPLPRKRWAVLAVLLLTEYLVLSVLYDATPLRAYAGVLGLGGRLGPLFAAVASALYAFGRLPPLAAQEIAEACWPLPRLSTRAPLHGLAVAVFFVLSARVLGGTEPPSGLWAIVWALAGLSVVSTAVGMGLSRRALRPLVRVAARPLLLGLAVGAAAFAAGLASEALWSPLATSTFHVTTAVLGMLGVHDVFVDLPTRQLGLRGFVVEIEGICSGAQGLGLTTVFIATYLVRFRRTLRFPRAFVLFPVGLLAAYFVNVLRIAALMLIGAFVSDEVAFGGFHSKAGWVLNVGLALALLLWVRRSRFFKREARVADAQEDGDNPTLTYLAPILTSTALAMLTGLVVATFDSLYPVRVVGAGVALFLVRRGLISTSSPPSSSVSPSVSRSSWSVAVAIGVGVLVVWLFLARHASPEEVIAFRATLAGMSPAARWGWIASRAMGAVLMAVVEEIAFRGFLLRRLVSAEFWTVEYRSAAGRLLPVVASSLAFGALHEGAIIAATLAGVAYAASTAVRGRLSDAIVAHAVTNGLLVVYAMGFDHWEWLI
ncbi:MAG: prenyl protease-related protein [Myxococcales bacterium]|nr:prenyl protease-related protein [Myxococcales bacterium]